MSKIKSSLFQKETVTIKIKSPHAAAPRQDSYSGISGDNGRRRNETDRTVASDSVSRAAANPYTVPSLTSDIVEMQTDGFKSTGVVYIRDSKTVVFSSQKNNCAFKKVVFETYKIYFRFLVRTRIDRLLIGRYIQISNIYFIGLKHYFF